MTEGDRLLKIDVTAARTPSRAQTLQHAAELAPTFANYWYCLRHALVSMAEGGERGAYERAKAPLQQCVARDPNIAECHYLLARASLWTNDEQAALRGYSQAIVKSPSTGYFYPPLAELYLALGMHERAEAVLREAARCIFCSRRFWGVALPNPLPAVGAKVSVTGTYAATFAMAASLSQVDPFMGILRYQSMRDLEPAKELASLPSVRRRRAPRP